MQARFASDQDGLNGSRRGSASAEPRSLEKRETSMFGRSQDMKRIAFVAAIIAGLSLVGSQTALGATDPGCAALGGNDGGGVCEVSAPVSVNGVINLAEPLHLLAGGVINVSFPSLTLNIGPANSGNGLVMEPGSMIDGGDFGCGGPDDDGHPITINANGNIDIKGPA